MAMGNNQPALPNHWNQKQELGPADTRSKYSWAQVIRAAARKKLRITRDREYYKLYLPSRILRSKSLDVIMEEISVYEALRAQR